MKNNLSAKDRLEKAYFELVEEKHFSLITVSELIKKAQVSRTTFYRHYVDIFDMYEKVGDHMLEAFSSVLLSYMIETSDANLNEILDSFFPILEAQNKYIISLCGKRGSRSFFEKIFNAFQNKISLIQLPLSKEELFKVKFIIYAGIGYYVEAVMLESKIDYEIAKFSHEILSLENIVEGMEGV